MYVLYFVCVGVSKGVRVAFECQNHKANTAAAAHLLNKPSYWKQMLEFVLC